MTLQQNKNCTAGSGGKGLLAFLWMALLILVVSSQTAQAFKGSIKGSLEIPNQPVQVDGGFSNQSGTGIEVGIGANNVDLNNNNVDLNNVDPNNNNVDLNSFDPNTAQTLPNSANNTEDTGSSSIASLDLNFLKSNPDVSFLGKDIRDKDGRPIRGFVNPALVRGASIVGTMYPPTPSAQMGWNVESNVTKEMYYSGLNQLNGFNGNVNSDLKTYAQELQAGNFMARTLQYPSNVANQARAQTLATANAAGNAMGDMAKGQSASAISYCSSFMRNFTAEEGNRWNKIRNGLFVPIAILLLLPGAILTQIKAMVSAGNPALGDMNPFDGILRSVVAIFLIPATFLVVNYGIDFSNSVVASIAGTYQNVIGRNMYKDALGAEFRAFPVRSPKENQNTGAPKKWPVININDVRDYEDMFVANKIVDPTIPEYIVPKNKTDEAMPAGAVAARELTFGTNAALTAAWNILCAFQMAYLAYLFFVGPIVAALWVWPMKQFRDALPNWIEGVCTVCFWSLFWNTAILLMACFKGVDESGTMITTALNFLATSSVKYAFDFAGLVKAAGQQAAQKALEKGGAKGGAGKAGAKGASGGNTNSGGKDGGKTHGNNNGKTSGTTAGNTNSESDTNTQTQSSTLTPTMQLSSFMPADRRTSSNSIDFQMPPLSLKVDPQVSSQSAQLGNYVITRGMQEGKQVDFLQANGKVIAVMPAEPLAQVLPHSVPLSQDSSIKADYNAATGMTTYTLDENGKQHTASMQSMNGLSIPFSAPFSKDSDVKDHALALKSQSGTLLLENNGSTVLVPRANGAGYDSYSLEPGATDAKFSIGNNRNLEITKDAHGTHVAINNGKMAEQFAVSADAKVNGFSISHDVNGKLVGSTVVSANSGATVYTNIDSHGNVTDRDTIEYNSAQNLNQITTEYFDPSKPPTQPIGTAVRLYDAQGNYTARFRDASNVEVAHATHTLTTGGGFEDIVYHGKEKVSVQDAVKNEAGGFNISTQQYKDGLPLDAVVVSYDSSMNIVAASPAVLAKNSHDRSSVVASVPFNASSVSNTSTNTPIGLNQANARFVSNNSTLASAQTVSNSSTLASAQTVSNNSTFASAQAVSNNSTVSNVPTVVNNASTNVSLFMNRISNATNTERHSAEAANVQTNALNVLRANAAKVQNTYNSEIYDVREFENNELRKEGLAATFEVHNGDSLQQQIVSAPIANSNRPRGLSQVFNTTRPVVNTEAAPQTGVDYTW